MKPCRNAHWGCEGEVGDNATNDDCHNCRAHDRRWSHRKPTEVRAWADKVGFWAKRQRALVRDDRNKGAVDTARNNVTPMRRRA